MSRASRRALGTASTLSSAREMDGAWDAVADEALDAVAPDIAGWRAEEQLQQDLSQTRQRLGELVREVAALASFCASAREELRQAEAEGREQQRAAAQVEADLARTVERQAALRAEVEQEQQQHMHRAQRAQVAQQRMGQLRDGVDEHQIEEQLDIGDLAEVGETFLDALHGNGQPDFAAVQGFIHRLADDRIDEVEHLAVRRLAASSDHVFVHVVAILTHGINRIERDEANDPDVPLNDVPAGSGIATGLPLYNRGNPVETPEVGKVSHQDDADASKGAGG